MKNKNCTIKTLWVYILEVQTTDGYIWTVNPKLLESVEGEKQTEQPVRCFQTGDRVKIKDMKKDEMKKHILHHGIHWSNSIFRVSNSLRHLN